MVIIVISDAPRVTSWMVDKSDPARREIADRALSLGIERNITSDPNAASHPLGLITLADGKVVMAHVVHAVDPIITNGKEVVMINRTREPGLGLPCLPGGFIDPLKGGVESAINAAAREAMEEVGVKLVGGDRVGTRKMDRPFDVRVAQLDYTVNPPINRMAEYGINVGDIFIVSTQAVIFHVPYLKKRTLTAGDDAAAAYLVPIDSLTRDGVGIGDHFDMIQAAQAQFPDLFSSKKRKSDHADAPSQEEGPWRGRLRERDKDKMQREASEGRVIGK